MVIFTVQYIRDETNTGSDQKPCRGLKGVLKKDCPSVGQAKPSNRDRLEKSLNEHNEAKKTGEENREFKSMSFIMMIP